MIQCSILAIGEELLEGSIVDTNSSFLAKNLSRLGFTVRSIELVPDDVDVIVDTILSHAKKDHLILTTGGLGPTFDDLTATAVAKAANLPLKLNEKALSNITKRLNALGVKLKDNHKHQAMLPEGAMLFDNNHGTALGFGVKIDKAILVSMPGVPFEMKPMFTSMIPQLLDWFAIIPPYTVDLIFGNIPESDVDDVIRKLTVPNGTKCIINASLGEIIVKIRDEDRARGEKFAESLKSHLATAYVGFGEGALIGAFVEKLKEHKLTLSVAESCTGGMISAAITDISGSSAVFYGGVISYDNSVKTDVLGVSKETISSFGAVSELCAKEMAIGVKKLLKTDCAISVTGIAGPNGGTDEKPVGTVVISVIYKDVQKTTTFNFRGERNIIRTRSVKAAINMLHKLIS